jgi:hypothetical protein
MKKMMFLLSAFVLLGSYGYAQNEKSGDHPSGTDASVHGSTVSDLAQNTTVTGKDKGALISSAARAQALTVANANARFIRGDAKPSNANVNANANVVANLSGNAGLNGKPSTLPPVTPPTMGQPVTTPVGKPIGVPVAVTAHVGVGVH